MVNFVGIALEQITDAAMSASDENKQAVMCAYACVSISMMRGSFGEQFVREFLSAALSDLDGQSETYTMKKQ